MQTETSWKRIQFEPELKARIEHRIRYQDGLDIMSKRAIQQYLQSLKAAGVTHLPSVDEEVIEAWRRKVQEQTIAVDAVKNQIASHRTTETSKPSQTPPTQANSRSDSTLNEKKQESLCNQKENGNASAIETVPQRDYTNLSRTEREQYLLECSQTVAKCERCPQLVSYRTQTVFGVGNPEAEIFFLGEAPGREEDLQGEPFVGPAGQLLNKIIEACQLTREEIYICNILRCRPPGNRNPQPIEASNCREFLETQIQIVDPDYIVCWGSIAARNLLKVETTIGRLRGKFHTFGRAKVLCTYHPSYLLRNPPAKKKTWEDMKFLRKDMGVEL